MLLGSLPCFFQAEWTVKHPPLPTSWPQEGKVEFRGYGLRYRDDMALVLRDINVTISGGEKVGCGPGSRLGRGGGGEDGEEEFGGEVEAGRGTLGGGGRRLSSSSQSEQVSTCHMTFGRGKSPFPVVTHNAF